MLYGRKKYHCIIISFMQMGILGFKVPGNRVGLDRSMNTDVCHGAD